MTEETKFNKLQLAVLIHVRQMLEYFRRTPVDAMLSPLEYFETMNLPEGDFEWKHDEAGDWNAYQCGESDCSAPGGWHKSASGVDLGRKDGKLWMEVWTVDQDGDKGDTTRWDEGDPLEHFQEMTHGELSDDHFIGWANYCLWCAENGSDPLYELIDKPAPDEWVDFWLDGALSNLRYLYIGYTA